MTLFKLLLPASFILFFLWKSYNTRIFLLGIPFLQVMGNSIFIENLVIFTFPNRFEPSIHILMWVFVVWFVTVGFLNSNRQRELTWKDLFGPLSILPEELIIIALSMIWLLNLFFALFNAADLNGVITTGTDLGCMFLGYLLLRGIVSHASMEDIRKFLFAIIMINAIAATLYILNQGLHLQIYEGDQLHTENYMSAVITRGFWWMPRFYFLSLAYVVSRSRLNLVAIGILLITLVNAFFTYSRNTLIIYAFIIILVIIISLVKRRIVSSIFRTVGIALTSFVLFIFISQYFPSELGYLVERFEEINSAPSISNVSNIADRMEDLQQTFDITQESNMFFGLGMVSQVTNPEIFYIEKWTADITWVGILYRYGIIGVVLFVGLFMAFGFRTLREYFRTSIKNEEEDWLMFFLVVFATFVETFISWTILDYRNMTLSLWFFVFISILVTQKGILTSVKTLSQEE